MAPATIPIIDFSGFYSSDPAAKTAVVDQIREQCGINGFFQITGHRVNPTLQENVLYWSKQFFALSDEAKQTCSKDNNTWNRGYEMLRSQILEEGTQPELKEGFYIGADIPTDHPYFVNKKLNSGPNQWPVEGFDEEKLEGFKSSTMSYYNATVSLASDVLQALALSLSLDETFFSKFMDGAVATMRLLHYPVQPPDSDAKLTRGIGAHTDFGAITLLLQDDVDGLQVWDKHTDTWIDVEPVKGAYVVNLGNLMQRWTNEKYISNVHRVINRSGKERFSIPIFISGNPDYVVECIPSCKAVGEASKFPPTTVEAAVSSGYAESYGRAQRFKQGLERAVAASA
ncbi:hypothetical protein SEUCBS139899_006329 [Sporothrix eucalyptigena]|uniref:Fe2OG dioxygenase domain-containing protein n=1 Tax=Sporothrix eucalyptigena TaxID=1812306 RepID=A0ABP0BY73_9PEZI